jgi:hypothetical protein
VGPCGGTATLVAAPRAQSAVKAQVSKTEVRVAASRAAHTAHNFCMHANGFPTTDLNNGRTNRTIYFVPSVRLIYFQYRFVIR